MNVGQQPWILSARFDTAFILAPAILITIAVIALQDRIAVLSEMPPWLWLILVVGVDAGHVYTTLFRTYLVKTEWRQRQALLTFIPLFAWLAGCLLYSIDALVFWRALAYLAIFHFVRQQYGFMMLYGRHEKPFALFNIDGNTSRFVNLYAKRLDKAAIYLATLYPLIYWHCQGRSFDWFIDGDIFRLTMPWLNSLIAMLYIGVLVMYLLKEIWLMRLTDSVNLPRNLILCGTALSWYVGIVAFDNDLAFSATNIIAHGIPYYALIWAYGRKQTLLAKPASPYWLNWIKYLFNRKSAYLYLGLVIALAYVEESIWDATIWLDHPDLFAVFNWLPKVDSPQILSWLIPLLALPQTTHYLLDAYIWRLHKADTDWKQVLFQPLPS